MLQNVKHQTLFAISYSIFAIVVSIFFLQIPDSCVFGGVDGSFRYAFNEFFAHNKNLFTQIKYPCGPLLFLKYPISFNNHIVLANIFELCVRFILSMYILQFAMQFVNKYKYIVAVCLSIFCAYFLYLDYLLAAVAIYACTTFIYTNNIFKFSISILVFAVALFIKSGISMPIGAVWFMLCIVLVYNKKFKNLLYINLILLGLCVSISVAIYGSAIAFFKHIYTDVLMSVSYGSESILFVKNNWWLLAISVACVLIIPILKNEKLLRTVFGLVSLYIFIMWKYSISRQDESHNFNWLFMLLIVTPIFIITAKQKIKVGIFCIISFVCFALNTKQVFGKVAIWRVRPTFEHFNLLFLHTAQNKQERLAVSVLETQKFKLNNEILKLIGTETVDIYPYEISIAFANKLNYKPRTCLQINAFGVHGDALDSMFYASTQKPEFILWHASDTKNIFMDALDGKHLQHENAGSVMAILQNYALVYTDSLNYYLFKNNEKDSVVKKELLSTNTINFNTPILLSTQIRTSNETVLLQCNWKNYGLLNLQKFLYKGLQYTIEYTLIDNSVVRYAVSEQALRKGIIINKLLLTPNANSKKIKYFKIICNNKNLHSTNLQANFIRCYGANSK